MILFIILASIIIYNLRYLSKKQTYFVIFHIVLSSLICFVQIYTLINSNGAFVVGSDASWYYNNAKSILQVVKNLDDLMLFFDINNISEKYYLFTLFNSLSIQGFKSEWMGALFLQLNYALIIQIFLIKVIKYINNIKKVNYLLLNLILFNLYWVMILNFRDGFIAIVLCLFCLNLFYEENSFKKYINIIMQLIILYFLRNEFVYIIVSILLVDLVISKLFYNYRKIIVFMLVLIIPIIIGIYNGGINVVIMIFIGISKSILVNNPIKFLIYLLFNYTYESSWIITPITEILSIIMCLSMLFFVYPLIIQGFGMKVTNYNTNKYIKINLDYASIRFWSMAVLFFIVVYSIYSIELGAVQDRIKIIPNCILLLWGMTIERQDTNKYYKLIILLSYIYIFIHTLSMWNS